MESILFMESILLVLCAALFGAVGYLIYEIHNMGKEQHQLLITNLALVKALCELGEALDAVPSVSGLFVVKPDKEDPAESIGTFTGPSNWA